MLILSLCGCQTSADENKRPSGVLSRDSMISVLTDIHLVEGAKIGDKIIGDTLKAADYFKRIYKKHGLSHQRFETSFEYYCTEPKTMDAIYDEVIENLNRMEVNPPRESLLEQDSTLGEE